MDRPLLTRFAPTPSGFLHTGNAFSFLLTWCLAKKNSGKILLRIDDLDSDRARPEYIRDIFESLEWLGTDYDLGPKNENDFFENWSQQKRIQLYHSAIQKLMDSRLVFSCECSRTQLRKQSKGQGYPGTCENKSIPMDRPDTSLRMRVPKDQVIRFSDSSLGECCVPIGKDPGSFVIRRRDGIPAYFIASLVDDLEFKVNTIVRGHDLLTSTAVQLFLSDHLQQNTFRQTTFLHHPLVKDKGKNKLSKSEGAFSLKQMRENQVLPSAVISSFAEVSGMKAPLPETLAQLLDGFDPEQHGKQKEWSL